VGYCALKIVSCFEYSLMRGLAQLRHFAVHKWYVDHLYNAGVSLSAFMGGYQVFKQLDKG
jgi:hypothetical protein